MFLIEDFSSHHGHFPVKANQFQSFKANELTQVVINRLQATSLQIENRIFCDNLNEREKGKIGTNCHKYNSSSHEKSKGYHFDLN